MAKAGAKRSAVRPAMPRQSLALIAAFFVLLSAAIAMRLLPWPALPAYLLASLAGYGSYRADKRAARGGQWRVSENRLHWISLLGGWPGALLAQSLLRHKRSKLAFMLVFWCTVVANLALLVLCATAMYDASWRHTLFAPLF